MRICIVPEGAVAYHSSSQRNTSEVVCKFALCRKEFTLCHKEQLVYPLYASSYCATRSHSVPQQLTEEQDGGGRSSLETRITEWLAQTLKGCQCHDNCQSISNNSTFTYSHSKDYPDKCLTREVAKTHCA